jgi:hypothetical protein
VAEVDDANTMQRWQQAALLRVARCAFISTGHA